MYIEGKGLTEIVNTLEQMGVVGKNGKPLTVPGVLYILGNETYVGDKILQKQAPKNYLTKQPDKNAVFESNYLTDDHKGIISRDEWNAVQLLMKARRDDITNGIRYHGGKTHFLYGKVFCEECGSPMTRRTLTGYGGVKYKVWVCRDRHLGRKGNGCKMRTIREDELMEYVKDGIGAEPTEDTAGMIDRVEVGMDGIDVTAALVKAAG